MEEDGQVLVNVPNIEQQPKGYTESLTKVEKLRALIDNPAQMSAQMSVTSKTSKESSINTHSYRLGLNEKDK